MAFNKIRTIRVSERVFDIVCEALDNEVDNDVKIDGWLETFNNCREQGYVLHVDSVDFDNPLRTRDTLYIWVHEHRNGDSIVVRWQKEYPTSNGMYNDETYNNRSTWFHYDELQKAADFILDLVKETFKNEFTR